MRQYTHHEDDIVSILNMNNLHHHVPLHTCFYHPHTSPCRETLHSDPDDHFISLHFTSPHSLNITSITNARVIHISFTTPTLHYATWHFTLTLMDHFISPHSLNITSITNARVIHISFTTLTLHYDTWHFTLTLTDHFISPHSLNITSITNARVIHISFTTLTLHYATWHFTLNLMDHFISPSSLHILLHLLRPDQPYYPHTPWNKSHHSFSSSNITY